MKGGDVVPARFYEQFVVGLFIFAFRHCIVHETMGQPAPNSVTPESTLWSVPTHRFAERHRFDVRLSETAARAKETAAPTGGSSRRGW